MAQCASSSSSRTRRRDAYSHIVLIGPGGRRAARADRTDPMVVREWAKSQGIEVKDRGRAPGRASREVSRGVLGGDCRRCPGDRAGSRACAAATVTRGSEGSRRGPPWPCESRPLGLLRQRRWRRSLRGVDGDALGAGASASHAVRDLTGILPSEDDIAPVLDEHSPPASDPLSLGMVARAPSSSGVISHDCSASTPTSPGGGTFGPTDGRRVTAQSSERHCGVLCRVRSFAFVSRRVAGP